MGSLGSRGSAAGQTGAEQRGREGRKEMEKNV